MSIPIKAEIIMLGLTLIATIYNIAKSEAKVYKYIDDLVDKIFERQAKTEKDLAVHFSLYEERRESVDYQLNSLNQKIDHKFNRLHSWVKELQDFLKEHGFFSRER